MTSATSKETLRRDSRQESEETEPPVVIATAPSGEDAKGEKNAASDVEVEDRGIATRYEIEVKKKMLADAEKKLAVINEDLESHQKLLSEAMETETFNDETGVGEDMEGNSIAKLEVTVCEGHNLPKTDMISGKTDPYVKLSVIPDSATADKEEKRTATVRKDLDPVFNESFVFQPILSSHASLLLELFDAEKVGSDEFIAQITIPLQQQQEQQQQQEHEAWYELEDPEGKSCCGDGDEDGEGGVSGELKVKTRFIYSNVASLQAEVDRLSKSRVEGEAICTQLKQDVSEMENPKRNPSTAAAAAAAVVDPRVAAKKQELEQKQQLLAQAQAKLQGGVEELGKQQQQLSEASKHERLNRETGVGEDAEGNSIAKLDVTVVRGRNLPKTDMFSGLADPYVRVSLTPTPGSSEDSSSSSSDNNSSSSYTEEKRTETQWKNRNPEFNESFVFQPILSSHASLLLELFDAEKVGTDEYVAQATIPLTSPPLADQQPHEQWYSLSDPGGKSACTSAITGELLVKTHYAYSEVVRLEQVVASLASNRKEDELEVARAQADVRAAEEGVAAAVAAAAAGGGAQNSGPSDGSTSEVALSKSERLAAKQQLLSEAERRVGVLNEKLRGLKEELAEVQSRETMNAETGVGEDAEGNSIAKLDVTIHEGRNLPKTDKFSGKADPYVKLSVIPDSATADKEEKQTQIKWKNRDPVFNQSFSFAPVLQRSATLVLELFDAQKVGSDEFIAQITIPLQQQQEQQQQQEEHEAWYELGDPLKKSGYSGELTGEIRVTTCFKFSELVPVQRRLEVVSGQRKAEVATCLRLRKEIRDLEGIAAFFQLPEPSAVDLEEEVLGPGEKKKRTLAETAIDWLYNDLEEDIGLEKILFPTPGTVKDYPAPMEPTDCVVM